MDRKRLFWLLFWVCLAGGAGAAEVIPPVPKRYFNDYAGVVSATTAEELNRKLEDFERSTSSQIIVAIYPKMQSNSSVEDYTVRVAQAWGVGRKGKDNGAILFVFSADRQMYLQVGYGLEGAIPDSIAKRITADVIRPYFRRNDYAGGMIAGVDAVLRAARGEYKGTGKTVLETKVTHYAPVLIFGFVFVLVALSTLRRRGTGYHQARRTYWGPGWFGAGWGGGTSGGGWSSGGGGGFSSGGGSFGGGGAGSSW